MSAEQKKPETNGSLLEMAAMLNEAVHLAMGPIRTAVKAMTPMVATAFLLRISRECQNEVERLVEEVKRGNRK